MKIKLANEIPRTNDFGGVSAGSTIELSDNGHIEATTQTGERVTLEQRPADVREAEEIESYVAGYKPGPFRADEVSQVILRPNDTDKYRTFSEDDAFKMVHVKVGSSAAINEVDPNSSLATYSVVPRVIGSFVPVVTSLQESTFDAMMAATRRARWAVDLDREWDVWRTLLGTTTNWDASVRTTLVAGQQWNGGANSNPIKDLQDALEKSLQPVSDIWMNQKVAHAFIRHADVKDHMRQFFGDTAQTQIATNIQRASFEQTDFLIPGFPPIHVTAAKAENPSTGTKEYIAQDYVWLTRRPPGVPTDGEDVATTYTFRREGPSGTGWSVREVEIGERGELGGTLVIVSMADVAKMTGNNVGGIITGVIQ